MLFTGKWSEREMIIANELTLTQKDETSVCYPIWTLGGWGEEDMDVQRERGGGEEREGGGKYGQRTLCVCMKV